MIIRLCFNVIIKLRFKVITTKPTEKKLKCEGWTEWAKARTPG